MGCFYDCMKVMNEVIGSEEIKLNQVLWEGMNITLACVEWEEMVKWWHDLKCFFKLQLTEWLTIPVKLNMAIID